MSGFQLAIVGHEPGDLTIIDPTTGEAIFAENATDAQIAAWRRTVVEWEAMARHAKNEVDRIMLDRMDKKATWTIRVGGFKMSAPSPAPTIEYEDPAGLRDELADLPDLDPEAISRAVVETVTLKVSADGVRALARLTRDDIDEVLARHRIKIEKRRYVKVEDA